VGHSRYYLLSARPGLLDDGGLLRDRLDDGRSSRLRSHLGWGRNDIGNLDGTLLELVRELFVQEISNHEDSNDSHDVEYVKGRLGGDFLDNGALSMVDDWGAHY